MGGMHGIRIIKTEARRPVPPSGGGVLIDFGAIE